MTRVVLADDQSLVRAGLRMILDAEPDLAVVGEAADGDEAIEVCRREQPDVVLMDVQMPGTDGLVATAAVSPLARVVILTTFERDDYVLEALRAGASGFLLKTSPPEDLVHAVRVVAAGDALLAPSVTRRVLEELVRRPAPARTGGDRDLRLLTSREVEVLQVMATGSSNAEIAERLRVGEATVKTHVSRVLLKLGLRDRVHAVVFAYEHGVVRPPASP